MTCRPKSKEKKTQIREYHTPDCGLFFQAERVIFRRKSRFQKIEIIHNDTYGKMLFLDNLVQTTENDEFFYHEMLVHPSMMVHENPERVLIIGGGDGGALRECLRYPIRQGIMVEIDSEVIQAAQEHFPWLKKIREDDRAEIIVGDGREYVEKKDAEFDVILVDSSDPVGPSQVLHQIQFYENLKKRLRSGGIAAAQVGSPLYHKEAVRRTVSELGTIFSRMRLYTAPVPTYPGGVWCYVFLSDDREPEKLRREPPAGLKYYNPETHRAAFSLPNFMRELLPGKGSQILP